MLSPKRRGPRSLLFFAASFTLAVAFVEEPLLAADHFIGGSEQIVKEYVQQFSWTRGCSPTAAAIVLSYWDKRTASYGNLLCWYLIHPSNGENVPQLIDWLATEMGTDSRGATLPANIHTGIMSVTNNAVAGDRFAGYSFTSRQVQSSMTPFTEGWDWCWNLITTEISNDRPFVWSVYSSDFIVFDRKGHSLAAVGYTDDKKVIVLDSNNGPGLSYWRYNYWDYRFEEEEATYTQVDTVVPGGGANSDIRLQKPRGGEWLTFEKTETISWNQVGSEITTVEIFLSPDSGNTWYTIENGVPSVSGTNTRNMVIGESSTFPRGSKYRLRLYGYDSAGKRLGADGSFLDFSYDLESPDSIVFDSDRSGRSQIYGQTLDEGGKPKGEPVQLTSAGGGAQQYQEPQWSLGASAIAYQFGASGVRGIHIIKPDGSSNVRLTPTFDSVIQRGPWKDAHYPCVDARDPSWSPDGLYIAYACLVNNNYDIWIHATQGTPEVTDDDFDYPLLNLNSSLELKPAWSPDGTMIAFVTSAPGKVGTGPNSKIAVTQIRSATTPMGPGGGVSFVETLGSYSILTDDTYTNTSPSWSPDSQMIAYSTTRSGGRDIYRMNAKYGIADGGSFFRLTSSPANDTHPAWSPDGRKIAFDSDRNGSYQIYLMSAVAGDADVLVPISQCSSSASCPNDTNPAWKPNWSGPQDVLRISVTPIVAMISGVPRPTGEGIVTVTDGQGNAVPGAVVSFVPRGTIAFSPQGGTTGSNGQLAFAVMEPTSRTAGDYQYVVVASATSPAGTGSVSATLRFLGTGNPVSPQPPGPVPISADVRIPVGQAVYRPATKAAFSLRAQALSAEAMSHLAFSMSLVSNLFPGGLVLEEFSAACVFQVYLQASHFLKLANDPPDSNYTTVALPSGALPPVIMGVGGAFSLATLRSMNEYLAGKGLVTQFLGAIVTSVNRYSTAIADGDLSSASLQRNAILAYEDALTTLLRREAMAARQFLASLQSDGIPDPQLSESEVAALQSTVATQGLPSKTVQMLSQLGLNADDIQSMTNSFINAPPASLTGSLFGQIQAEAAASEDTSTTLAQASPAPESLLSVLSAHDGSFRQGQSGAPYTITVKNASYAATTSGIVTVKEDVPFGLTLVSMAGSGWSCAASACNRSDALAGGDSYPPIAVTVNVAVDAPPSLTNYVSVSGGGSGASYAADPTLVQSGTPSLGIASTHVGSFYPGQFHASYALTVSNAAGAGATSGTVTVTDTIPTGLSLISMAGNGWSCVSNICTRLDALLDGASYPAITVVVNVAQNAPSSVTNSVTVSGGGSATASADDPTTIQAVPGMPPLQWLGGGHTGGVRTVGAAPDGTVWSAGGDGTIKQWNASNMSMIRTSPLIQTNGAAFATNGQQALIISSDGVKLANLADGSVVRTFPLGNLGSGASLPAISGNGQTVAFQRSNWTVSALVFANGQGAEKTISASVFDPNGSFGGYWWGGVEALAVSADGQYVACVLAPDYKTPGTIRLYRVSDGTLLRTLTHNTAGVTALAFSPDGDLLASSSADGKINILRLSDLVVITSVTVYESGAPVSAKSLAFSPDGLLIAQGDSYAVRIYNVNTAASVARIPGNTSSVAFTPDSQWLTVGTDHDVKLWTVASVAPLPSIAPHFGSVAAVAYSPKGDLVASAGADYTVKLWRAADGIAVGNLTGHTAAVNAIAFSPDGDLLASAGSDDTIRIWRTSDHLQVTTLTGHTQAIRALSFSPNGSLLASGSAAPEQVVKLWQVGGSWASTSTLTGTGGSVTSVQFSPDGQLLAGASDGGVVRLWQVTSGSLVRTYLAPSQGTMSLAWSPDGQILAAGWQQNILVFQGTQVAPILTVPAHNKNGTVVAYSPDGTRLLSGNPDGTLKLWNTSSWSVVTTYTQETFASGTGITFVGYSADNTQFVYARGDATIGVVGNPDSTTPLPIEVTVTTNPAGLGISVDSIAQIAPYTFISAPGSSHTISVVSPQGSNGIRQVFEDWSDGGSQSHTITPVASRIYNASFTTQYLLTEQITPAEAGTITNSPPSPDGFYSAGTVVHLTAAAAVGYTFGSWSGDVVGNTNPVTVSMTQPHEVTAIFGSASMADIAVTMTSSLTQVNNGKPLAFMVTVTNLGPAAFSPTLKDALPGALSFVSVTPSQGSCSGTVIITCALDSIAAGASATVTINVTPNATGSVSNSASVDAGTTDPNPENNSATATVLVLPAGLPPMLWMGGATNLAESIFTTLDGKIWTNGPNEIMQWRVLDMSLTKTLAQDSRNLNDSNNGHSFAVTADGKYFAYGTTYTSTWVNGQVGVYRSSDGSLVRSFNGFQNSCGVRNINISLSDDGQTLAFESQGCCSAGCSCILAIFDVLSGGAYYQSWWNGTAHNVVALSPDGLWLAAVSGTEVALYQASTGTYVRSFTGHISSPNRLMWSGDSALLMTASSSELKVWRISDFLMLQSFTFPSPGQYYSAAISRDGHFVAFGGSDITVWQVDDGSVVTTIPYSASVGSVRGINFTPDDQWLICGGNNRLSAFALPQGTPAPYKTGIIGSAAGIAYSQAGNLIAAVGADYKVSVWDSSSGKVLSSIDVSSSGITGVAFSPDGSLLAVGVGKAVSVWNTASFGLNTTLTGHAQAVRAVAFSPDGTLLASASASPENVVKLWSTQTWTIVRTLTGASSGLRSVQFSPDGKTVVAGGDDGIAREWKVTTGAVVHSYLASGQGAVRIYYSPDGTKLAAGWTGKVLVFNVGNSSPVQTLNAHTANDTSVAWSPDGNRLISGNPDGTVDVWDTATWGQLTQYNTETYAQNGGVLTVAYSPDNSQFAYGRADAVLVVVDSGSPPTGTLTTVATDPTGLSIVIDGATVTSPQTYRWAAGSIHTLGAPSPQTTSGTRNVYQSWNDGGAQSHTITTSATSATYTAQFKSQYLLSPVVSPSAAGSIVVTPPSVDGFYDAGTAIQAIATSNSGYSFSSWSGDATGTTNPALLAMNGPRSITATYTTLPTVTVTTSPPGLSIIVDGAAFTAPQTFHWAAGSSHVIVTTALQGSQLARSAFVAWSDNGALNHTITAPASSATYTASFIMQYPLALSVSPAAGGTITANPDSTDGYYNAGTTVQLTATAANGYQFLSWSGDVTGTASPRTVGITAAKSVTANFGPILVGPSVTINQAAGQADPANVSPINFTVVFSESVTGFSSTGVTISGTAPGTKTVVITGSGTTYNVAVSGMSGPGTVIASINSGAATSTVTSLPNQASTSTDNTVTFTGSKKVRGQITSW